MMTVCCSVVRGRRVKRVHHGGDVVSTSGKIGKAEKETMDVRRDDEKSAYSTQVQSRITTVLSSLQLTLQRDAAEFLGFLIIIPLC